MEREICPLIKVADAYEINTDIVPANEIVNDIIELFNMKLADLK
jgi:cytidylate kinase